MAHQPALRVNPLTIALDTTRRAALQRAFAAPSDTTYDVPSFSARQQDERIVDGWTIAQSDLNRFRDCEWLSTSCVQAIGTYINRSEQAVCSRVSPPLKPRVLFVTPDDFCPRTPVRFSTLFRARFSKLQHLVTVVNTDSRGRGSHWVAYHGLVDHQNRKVRLRLFDSMGACHARDADVARVFCFAYTTEEEPEPYTCSGVEVVQHRPCQENADDCGVFALAVCMFLFSTPSVVFADDAPFTAAHIPRFREVMASIVLNF